MEKEAGRGLGEESGGGRGGREGGEGMYLRLLPKPRVR